MKSKFVAIVFVALMINLLSNAQSVTLGYVDFPPYEFESTDGRAEGVLVEIVQTVFQKADIPLELKFLPFQRALTTAQAGTIDGLFNFYKNPERLEHFDYSYPVINNPLVLFVMKDSTLTFNGNLDSLSGKKIGVLRGYTYGKDFDDNSLFVKDISSSHPSNLKKLALGRIDAYPCDRLVGIFIARQEKLMSELKILQTPLKVMEGHIGFTKGKHQNVLEKINPIIAKMRQNGDIERMIDAYVSKQ
ncbi:transporter substrate-binding domain-containing protein [bacterium]|nr:transporter substrate-binding domain-containing protein [bacterium]